MILKCICINYKFFLLLLFISICFLISVFLNNYFLKNKDNDYVVRFFCFFTFCYLLGIISAILLGLIESPDKNTLLLIFGEFIICIFPVLSEFEFSFDGKSLKGCLKKITDIEKTGKKAAEAEELKLGQNESDSNISENYKKISGNETINSTPNQKTFTGSMLSRLEEICCEKFKQMHNLFSVDFQTDRKMFVGKENIPLYVDACYKQNGVMHFVEIKKFSPSIINSKLVENLLSKLSYYDSKKIKMDLTLVICITPDDSKNQEFIESVLHKIYNRYQTQILSGLLRIEKIVLTQEEYDIILSE